MPATLNLVPHPRAGLPLYGLGEVLGARVDVVVTGRLGGVSRAPYDSLNLALHVGDDPAAVAENRRRVGVAMDLDVTRLVIASQVHGAQVNDVDGWTGDALVGDALVTTRDDVALCVLVADCVPLVFVEPDGARIAVAHAGWRGLVAGVIPATLSHFARPPEVRVVIGPHISARRYQVGPEVAQHFSTVPGACRADEGDRRRLDLGVIARHQLIANGVRDDHVTHCEPDTDDATTFFSDRAQRPGGRFAMVARRASYHSSVGESE